VDQVRSARFVDGFEFRIDVEFMTDADQLGKGRELLLADTSAQASCGRSAGLESDASEFLLARLRANSWPFPLRR
jgi:hypothetical protein